MCLFWNKIIITPNSYIKNHYHSTICMVMAVGYSPSEAIRDVKIQAKKAGANAIICFECIEEIRDFENMRKPWEVKRKIITSIPEYKQKLKTFMYSNKKAEQEAVVKHWQEINLHNRVRFYKVTGIAVNVID